MSESIPQSGGGQTSGNPIRGLTPAGFLEGSLLEGGPAREHELHHLLSALADDALSDAEFARLDHLLSTDPQARALYVRHVNLCEQLGDLVVPSLDAVSGGLCHTDDLAKTAENHDAERHAPLSDVPAPSTGQHPLRFFTRRPLRIAACSAAAIVFLAAGLLFVDQGQRGDRGLADRPVAVELEHSVEFEHSHEGMPNATGPLNTEATAHVAVITSIDRPVWGSGSSPSGVGSAVGLQTLSLTSGRIELDFGSGAKVFLRGPAEFSLLSTSRGKLHFGELSASVPDGAEGFVIDTPSVEVVDLGTEFGVSVNRAGVADLHVFKGAVEARTTGIDEQPGSLFRLEASQTRRFAPDTLLPTEMPYNAAWFPSVPQFSSQEPQTRGAVCLLRLAPETVEADKLESDDFILLFEERSAVTLARPLPVTFSDPGRYDLFRGKSKRLAAGTCVSSYLLHFDSVMLNGRSHRLRLDGSVTFPHPILGVIAAGKHLLQTDRLLGHPETAYGDIRSRGLDSNLRGDTYDIVTLSEDRLTLDLSFSVRKSCDQLRVLIAAPAAPQQQGTEL